MIVGILESLVNNYRIRIEEGLYGYNKDNTK